MSKFVATLIAGLFATSAFAQSTATQATTPATKAEAKEKVIVTRDVVLTPLVVNGIVWQCGWHA